MSGLQGIYILTSRMQTKMKQMDAAAVNVANVNTTGFKAQAVDFETVMGGNPSRPAGNFVLQRGFRNNFNQGVINQTGNPLDMAIVGQGFFAIQGPPGTGPILTRDGRFSVSSTGTLVNQQGQSVLDNANVPIRIPEGVAVKVTPDGSIVAGDDEIAQVGVFQPPLQAALIRIGSNQFRLENGAPAPLENQQIVGGGVEGSNVDPIMETVKLNEVSQAYQSAARLMSRLEDLQERAIRALPRQSQ